MITHTATSHRISSFYPLRLIIVALIVACGLIFSMQQAHAASPPASPDFGGVGSCHQYFVQNIALGQGQSPQYTIYGELCNPLLGPSKTVQLLIHGATYSHLYWDWPAIRGHPTWPLQYSAVLYLTAAGYSTFNIDRIGIGNSSHPPADQVTIGANAYVVHQLVGDLKAGSIGGVPFKHVILDGHSLGSIVSIAEAGQYQDVDGVVLTGLLHLYNLSHLALLESDLIPAPSEPAGYFTTAPGTRGALFYYAPGTFSNLDVINYDEQTKQTIASGEFISSLPDSSLIKVPVLEVVGQEDAFHCDPTAVDCSSNATVYQEESPFFSPQAQLQVQVIPDTGHDLNLHPTAPLLTYPRMIAWAYRFVPPDLA